MILYTCSIIDVLINQPLSGICRGLGNAVERLTSLGYPRKTMAIHDFPPLSRNLLPRRDRPHKPPKILLYYLFQTPQQYGKLMGIGALSEWLPSNFMDHLRDHHPFPD